MSNIVPFEQQQCLAVAFAKSGLFGIKTTEQALALMALCEAEGLHPAIAVRDYHIIHGRPALKADAMLARFQAAGGAVRWTAMTDKSVCGVFTHPQGGEIEISWDMARAQQADLADKDNWLKFPRQMLRARVISEGVRTVFPGCVVGVYTPEEEQDGDTSPAKPRGNETRIIDAETVQQKPEIHAPPALLEEARAAAAQGKAVYEKFWEGTGKDNRKALANVHDALKDLAVTADTNHKAGAP